MSIGSYAKQENAVAAIRVSSLKQGLQGDSPEAQKEQIDQFAKSHNINIKKYFVFMESASKEEQPVQEAIDYCKNPKNDIQLVLIKSIDRFTRGGSYFYDLMKMQLVKYGVKLVDLYGIIGNQQVNTLEHLGIEFPWSVYSPTKKAEILEAERAKDEIRDILSRMIGAEIRYVRMGYRVRPAPYGYENAKVETSHGKRVILKPHPEEAKYIIKMFELRARGDLNDHEIVEEVNKLGYKSRIHYKRNPQERLQIIGQTGRKKLNLKRFWEYIKKPIYAGVNDEKWTQNEPVKTKFDGLVSIELFNQANRGKVVLSEEEDGIKIYKNKPPEWRTVKKIKNPDFPYKKYVLCSECRSPLYGSASTGRGGKKYAAYHCNKNHESFRIPVEDFNETVEDFIRHLKITEEGIQRFKKYILSQWDDRIAKGKQDIENIEEKIKQLEEQKTLIGEKIAILVSEEAIRIIEKKLTEISVQIKDLQDLKAKREDKKINMEIVAEIIGYFLENLEFIALGGADPIKNAAFFGLIFEVTPTYQDLISRTAKLAPYIKLIEDLDGDQVRNCEPTGARTRNQKIKSLLLYH